MVLGMALKCYSNMAKGLKLKLKKLGELIPFFRVATWEKLVGGYRVKTALRV